MKRHLYSLLLLLSVCYSAEAKLRQTNECTSESLLAPIYLNLTGHSQEIRDSVAVYGNVSDSFTYELLKDVHIEILRADSSLICDFYTGPIFGYGGYRHNIDQTGCLYVPRQTCLFRFSKEGYIRLEPKKRSFLT